MQLCYSRRSRALQVKPNPQNLTRHVVHDHVQVFSVLECEVQLNDPLGVGVRHDVALLPEEGAVTALDLEEDGVASHQLVAGN